MKLGETRSLKAESILITQMRRFASPPNERGLKSYVLSPSHHLCLCSPMFFTLGTAIAILLHQRLSCSHLYPPAPPVDQL